MDVSHQADLHVQRMSMWLLKAAWVVAIFRGALMQIQLDNQQRSNGRLRPITLL
jgi:hypothetical protein